MGDLDSISEELEDKLEALLQKIGTQSEEEIVKLRMSELALSKVTTLSYRYWSTPTGRASLDW